MVRLSSPIRDLKGYLTLDEVNIILEAAKKNHWKHQRDYVLIMTLFRTGRRIGEVLRSLKPSNIDFENSRILWNIEKRANPNHREWKPVDNYTLHLLWNFIRDNEIKPDEYVFTICRQRAYQIVRRYGKKVGLEKVGQKWVHPHTFRHSFAIHLAERIDSPADLRKLQNLMGHSEIATTAHYLQFSQKETKKLLDKAFS
jgi:integrase